MRFPRLSVEKLIHLFDKRREFVVVLFSGDFRGQLPQSFALLVLRFRLHLAPSLASCRTASVRILVTCSCSAERSSAKRKDRLRPTKMMKPLWCKDRECDPLNGGRVRARLRRVYT